MHLQVLIFALLLAGPSLCYRLFDSRDSVARSVIEACRSQTTDEKAQCHTILRCVLENIPSDFTARWSAGASILAFTPTIVGLMSNSINEITSIADDSLLLATILSMSSVTAFITRFGDRPIRSSNTVFEEQRGSHAHIQTALSVLGDLICESYRPRPWWKSGQTQSLVFSVVAALVGAGVWYEVYETTRYGIIVFACPVKSNIGIWIGLSQLLTLSNVLWRSFIFEIHTIKINAVGTRSARDSNTPSGRPSRSATLVLRSPRDTFLQWFLQTFTAVASFSLYAYGTVLLASVTLIPASDAIRAMVMLTISAGFGRLAGSWFTSPRRTGSRTIVVDVPADCKEEFTSKILGLAGVAGVMSSGNEP